MADDREFTCFAVGLMSGTSMDGIDACVLGITESAEDTGKELKCVELFYLFLDAQNNWKWIIVITQSTAYV